MEDRVTAASGVTVPELPKPSEIRPRLWAVSALAMHLRELLRVSREAYGDEQASKEGERDD